MKQEKQEKESSIVAAVCDYLAHKKLFFWRQNTTPIYSEGRFYAMPKYAKRGVPDIIVVRDGWFIGLEAKRKGAKLSDYQKEFQEGVEKAGGEYHIVRSIDDVKEIGL